MAAPQVHVAAKFNIEIVKGPHAGLRLSFHKDRVTIGRGPENDIVLSGDPSVSRQHAEIKHRQNSEFMVVNLSSKNYIIVNGHIVESELLSNDSKIQIGDSELVFKIDLAHAPVVSGAAAAPLLNLSAAMPAKVLPKTPSPPPLQVSSVPPAFTMPADVPPFKPSNGLMQNPKVRFYGIIGVVVVLGFLLFSPSKKQTASDPNEIRTSTISMQDFADAEKRSQELLNLKKEKYDTTRHQKAQENFVKGFRDFQQGQYARAREAFQVVLNLDPDNELAKRYFHLSKIKFDELLKFNMIQGNRYREKKNWRMCQSNYRTVMVMLSNRRDDPTYKEAKQYFDECTLNLEVRF